MNTLWKMGCVVAEAVRRFMQHLQIRSLPQLAVAHPAESFAFPI
jgi:hypothetical protein